MEQLTVDSGQRKAKDMDMVIATKPLWELACKRMVGPKRFACRQVPTAAAIQEGWFCSCCAARLAK